MEKKELHFEELDDFPNEQKAMRKTGVTASEIAAVAGLSPYTSIFDVWRSKTDLVDEKDMSKNYNIQRGRFLEGSILRWASFLTRRRINRNKETVKHPEHEIALATPDGYAMPEGDPEGIAISVCEAKSPGLGTFGHWADPYEIADGVPEYILPQVTWQQAVTGLTDEPAIVAALIGGNIQIYQVPYDEELFWLLLKKAERFMELVRTGQEPRYDSTSVAAEYVKDRYRNQTSEDMVEVGDPFWIEKAQRYIELKKSCDTMKKEMDILAGEFKFEIKHHAGMLMPGHKISWMSDRSGRVSWKAVAQTLMAKYQVPEPTFERIRDDNTSIPIRKFLIKEMKGE